MKLFKTKKKKFSKEYYFEKVCQALKKVMPDELQNLELKMDTELDDLGIQSFEFLNLMAKFEAILDENIEDILAVIDLSSIQTISDIIELMEEIKS